MEKVRTPEPTTNGFKRRALKTRDSWASSGTRSRAVLYVPGYNFHIVTNGKRDLPFRLAKEKVNEQAKHYVEKGYVLMVLQRARTVRMHRQAFGPRETVLGKEHPDTLMSMNNLAIVLRDQGNLGQVRAGGRDASTRTRDNAGQRAS
jgi:hypothetical protein